MYQEGLQEQAEFYSYHPLVSFFYFALVIGVAMFSNHPAFLAMSLLCGCVYAGILRGTKAWKQNLIMTLFLVVGMTLINGIFTHNGVTVLFYLNENRVTLEAMVFGGVSALLVSAVIIWFSCFQVMMSPDKFIYLFGRIAPVLALTLSMILRFLPLFQSRYREIRMGQRCMGRSLRRGSIFSRCRQFFKELSILIAWSLEASIESSDSMEARGYGLRGRTSFHLFRFQHRDGCIMAGIAVLGGLSVAGCILGRTSAFYYPGIWIKSPDVLSVVTAVSYLGLLLLPVVIDVMGEQKWKQLNFEM